MTTEYLSCAETAKLIRAALKRAFPNTKTRFSVKSSVYSGGASIRVSWEGGPDREAVEPVVRCFAGGRFDGSIDMAYNVDHWLMPDGSVMIARNPGSEGSGGYDPRVENPRPHPDARLVSFGADYVFCEHRKLTPEYA